VLKRSAQKRSKRGDCGGGPPGEREERCEGNSHVEPIGRDRILQARGGRWKKESFFIAHDPSVLEKTDYIMFL